MKMKKEQKIELAKGVANEIADAEGIIITSFKGLTFPQMDNIRRTVKNSGNDFRVIKNSLLKKALNSLNIDVLDQYLTESTAMVLVRNEFAAAAKDIKKYFKDYPPFVVKAGYFGKKLLKKEDVIAVADLPSRDQLLAQVLATMNAPIQNFVSLLANIPRSLLNVLNAVKEKK